MELVKKWQRLSFERKMELLLVPLLIALVSGIVVPRVNSLLTNGPAPRLRVVDLVVQNGPEWNPAIPLVSDAKPTVEVLLHNTGNQRSVINRAIFKIRNFAHLPTCATGGGLSVSGRYDILLPAKPKSGEVVAVPIHQQLGPDEADRFVFRFDLPHKALEEGGEFLYNIYQIDIVLFHDNDESLLIGTALISLPRTPSPSDIWLRDAAAGFDPSAVACERSNQAALRRMLALKGERSDTLDKVAASLGPPGAATTKSTELTRFASPSASATAPDSVDAAGNRVSYSISNVLDGDPTTAWRAPGNGQGATINLTLLRPFHLTKVGLVPGYAKMDPANGVDRFQQDRRVAKVRWHFSDGTTVDQSFTERPTMQRTTVDVTTGSVSIEILSTRPGDPNYNYTAISDVSLIGAS